MRDARPDTFEMLERENALLRDRVALNEGSDGRADPAIVESHVSKLRKRMACFGLTIRSERYVGYWIDEPGRSVFRRQTEGARNVDRAA